MPEYLSPGVYVEEVPSAVKPIAGVSTSTAGFIGVVPDILPMPPTLMKTKMIPREQVDGTKTTFDLDDYPVVTAPDTYRIRINGQSVDAELKNASGKSQIVFPTQQPTRRGTRGAGTVNAIPTNVDITVDYLVGSPARAKIGSWNGTDKTFTLPDYPVVTDDGTFNVRVGDNPVSATLENTVDDRGNPVARATITGSVSASTPTAADVVAEYVTYQIFTPEPAAGAQGFQGAKLCTNFTEYKNAFGNFSLDANHRQLTHAVYGFFNNGGTRCYVVRLTYEANIDKALAAFELVDEIAIVAAPGLNDANTRSKLVAHCTNMGDRFAILDSPPTESDLSNLTKIKANNGDMPDRTDYAAWYFPWIKVFDPVAKKYQVDSTDGIINVPPSGHIAGIYARIDEERGVHKAPANEAIMGALDVTQRLSKAQQDGLNPKGVNCIRVLNDNILVWGARTVGGDENADLKYINVRRTLLFLRKSIDEGTQWVVFEPNNQALWQKITRNVTAFLTNVWRSGALFGDTPQQAFYVKCDKETNPQSSIDNGQVVTEIGVALVRPAEFVIFRISQIAGAGS